MISKSQIYYIDSSKRLTGTETDFTYRLNINGEYTHCCVLQAIVPQSYYLVRNGLNKFKINENGVILEITIPRGNYNAISFRNKVKELLNSSCQYDYEIILPNSTQESNTGKYTFTVSGNGGVQPSFIFEDDSLLYEQFGFPRDSINTFVDNKLDSQNVVKFVPEDTVFIHSSICADDNNDILQEIYNGNSAQFGNIVYRCEDFQAYSKPIRSVNANIYSFKVTDENSFVLNTNGSNVMITLLLWKKDNIADILKNYILFEISKSGDGEKK